MLKDSRRETIIFLLGALAASCGLRVTSGFKEPGLPENCDRIVVPFPIEGPSRAFMGWGDGCRVPSLLQAGFPPEMGGNQARACVNW
jgi:hypothetical protein